MAKFQELSLATEQNGKNCGDSRLNLYAIWGWAKIRANVLLKRKLKNFVPGKASNITYKFFSKL